MAVEEREARTVRFPLTLINEAQSLKQKGESLNDFITEALEREVRRRKAMKTLDAVDELRERIRQQHELFPDSVQMIRELREGVGRRD